MVANAKILLRILLFVTAVVNGFSDCLSHLRTTATPCCRCLAQHATSQIHNREAAISA